MADKTASPPAAAPQDSIATETRVVPASGGPVETPEGPNPDLARAEVEAQLQREGLARAVQAPRTVAVPAAPITR